MDTIVPVPDFEKDTDYEAFGFTLANAPDGALLVNAEKAEEFDSNITEDVSGLLLLGHLTHDCEIYGHTFTLKTLTRGERLAISLFVQPYAETLGLPDAMQTAYLALAIVLVDGRPLTIALEDESPQQRLARNFDRVHRWFDPVVEALYLEYTKLLLRQETAFKKLEGKLTAGRATSRP